MHFAADMDVLWLVFCGLLTSLLVALSIIDVRSMILPDRLNLMLGVSGFAQCFALGLPGWRDAVLGSLIGGGLMALVAAVFHALRGRDGLGLGDVKFIFAAGLWVGWQGLPLLLSVASMTALAFVALRATIEGRLDQTSVLPFGPFLALGTLVSWSSMAAF
jgi:leader peptidase (prepilin peptidase)/N-methyltransferase